MLQLTHVCDRYQWVVLQIAALRELCCGRDIRNRLGKLPETLKAAYDQVYHQIKSQKESLPIIAIRAFQWVICSCWPLSPEELVAAVCQEPESDEIDEVYINIKTVLGACQNLLVIDQELNVCCFSHLSVQEYFETHHWSAWESDCLVGKVCLSFLINSMKQDALPTIKELWSIREQVTPLTKKDVDARDVLEYACFNWATHVKRLEENEIVENRLTALLQGFLGSMDESSLAYQNWHNIVGEYTKSFSRRFKSRSPIRSVPLLDFYHQLLFPCRRASLAIPTFGFHKTLLDWCTVGFTDINETNSRGDTLLMLAAMRGSLPIVEDLLKKGAYVNAAGGQFRGALQAASYHGKISVVPLLLS